MEHNVPAHSLDFHWDQKIMVKPPYNVLIDYGWLPDGGLEAMVMNEYLGKHEAGPIACAEFGRHAAILGSIHLSHQPIYKGKNYFLAIHAKLTRHTNEDKEHDPDCFILRTEVAKAEKREAAIDTQIRSMEGDLIYSATVEYMVLGEAAFSRLFAGKKIPGDFTTDVSPYKERKRLYDVEVKDGEAVGTYGTVQAEDCQGHFQDFPALPVALVGGLFCELGVKLFQKEVMYSDKIFSTYTDIRAFRLVFATEYLTFKAKIIEQQAENHVLLEAKAYVGDEVVAEVQFELMANK